MSAAHTDPYADQLYPAGPYLPRSDEEAQALAERIVHRKLSRLFGYLPAGAYADYQRVRDEITRALAAALRKAKR